MAMFIIALITWLFILIYPRTLSIKKKHIIVRMCIAAISVIAAFLTLDLSIRGHYLFSLIPIIIIFLFCTEIGLLFIPRFRSFLPLISCFITFFVFPHIANFCKVAYGMWDSDVNAGSAGYSELFLAGMHLWFIIMFIILGITLLVRKFPPFPMKPCFSAFGSLVFLISMNISFYLTVPRTGSEGLLLWMFIVPGFIIADLFLIIISVFKISLITQKKKMNNTEFDFNEISTDQ